MAACVNAGFRPRVVQEIADPFMILTLVAAGVGVALISDGVAADHAVRVGLRAAARPADLPRPCHRLGRGQPVGGAARGARGRRRGHSDACLTRPILCSIRA